MCFATQPRAKIFRRDQGQVTDMTSMKRIMRFGVCIHPMQHTPECTKHNCKMHRHDYTSPKHISPHKCSPHISHTHPCPKLNLNLIIFNYICPKSIEHLSPTRLSRYNDYEHDPYSNGNPDNAICARGDLRTPSPTPGGCLDTKVSDYFQSLKFEAEVVNGPTSTNSSYGPGQAPFDWRKFPKSPHMGQPTVFDFVFESAGPSWPHP